MKRPRGDHVAALTKGAGGDVVQLGMLGIAAGRRLTTGKQDIVVVRQKRCGVAFARQAKVIAGSKSFGYRIKDFGGRENDRIGASTRE